jgi:hypothetical protein
VHPSDSVFVSLLKFRSPLELRFDQPVCFLHLRAARSTLRDEPVDEGACPGRLGAQCASAPEHVHGIGDTIILPLVVVGKFVADKD